MNCFSRAALIADQRRWNRTGEIQRIELFISLAQSGRTVKDESAAVVGEAQDHRRKNIGVIGGRILAHEDRIEGLQRIGLALIEKAVMRLAAHHFASPREGERLMALRI